MLKRMHRVYQFGRNQFDIQVPGGGFGIFNKGCEKQWPGKWNWGNRYGGVTSR